MTNPNLVPILSVVELPAYINHHGGLNRVVAVFNGEEVVVERAGLDASDFERRSNVLVQARDGEWAGLAAGNVGYGGGGPADFRTALVKMGVDEEVAAKLSLQEEVDYTHL
ncbi:MAG TPA: hypothetical protein VFC72_02775 [Corynebacterium sp.]|nr:hypothetical protein [Corynebacterium sp.]